MTKRKDQPAVLILYDLDPSWTAAEQGAVIDEVESAAHALANLGYCTQLLPVDGPESLHSLARLDPSRFIVFNWCEQIPGIPRSEPLVAKHLERLGLTFTGASSEVLERSWNKPLVKERLAKHRIPTPAWRVFETPDQVDWNHFPAIVKPAYEHSSQGLTTDSVVLNPDELARQVRRVIEEFAEPALVEVFVDGRELHVPVWGNGRLALLPPVEMDFSAFQDIHDRLCTWDSKFDESSVHYRNTVSVIPAPLTPDEVASLEKVVFAAFRATGCRDYARMDVRLFHGVFFVLDVNPNADLSRDASFACAAEAAGIPNGRMFERIIELARRRRRRSRGTAEDRIETATDPHFP